MSLKTSKPELLRPLPCKPAGPGGTPSAAPAGLVRPLLPRAGSRLPAPRPPSIARFPGLLAPQYPIGVGGTAL